MTTIFVEYLNYHDNYVEKYGKKTIVLMQVGSFYECYSVQNKKESLGPNLSQISEILNIVYTRKDKSIDEITKHNPYMLGFPLVASTKFINMLVDNGYTVITVDQTTPPPKPKREVTNIYSPGTYIEGNQKPDNNNIVCLYIEEEEQKNTKSLLCIGMCSIDLTTGKVIINEAYSSSTDDKLALDEGVRFINNMNPKEIIIYYINKNNLSQNKENFIKSYLELDNKYYHFKTNIDNKYYKLNYQNEFLKKIYNIKSQISPLEYFDLNKTIYATMSLIILLDFSYDHNDKIIFNLERPEFYSNSKYLILGNNAISQLNIINNTSIGDVSSDFSSSKFKSVFDVVNNTNTPMGRRLLKERLIYPLIDKNELNKEYNYIDFLQKSDIYLNIENKLKGIPDLERLERKISLNLIQPYELYDYICSFILTSQIIEILNSNNLNDISKSFDLDMTKLANLIKKLTDIFNLDELRKQNLSDINRNFFNNNIYTEIDNLINDLNISNTFMDKLCIELSKYIDTKKNQDNVKIIVKNNERDGYYLSLTKLRCDELEKKLKNINEIKISNNLKIETKKLIFKHNNNSSKIFFPDLEKKSDEIIILKNKLNKLVREKYTDVLKNIYSENRLFLRKISNFISYIDLLKSNAKTAILYNYTKPIIEDNNNNSYVSCKNLRHPIIERIIQYEYVPHNFNIGLDELKGMLIFGINSAGKSSLMKSAGISIILAQAGMYVPASEYKFFPYKALFARITGNDNLFKGLSSFALEMVELNAILKRSNNSTLVIGDEVCRGTEHISGNAIVATTIINLSKTNASFIFATHLHELVNLEKIKSLHNVKPFHLSISYDQNKDEIIYDRLLKEGSGDNIYGITVARHIIHDKDFIDMALSIKNELLETHDTLISGKTSRYNSKLLVYECEICGIKEEKNKNNLNFLETHHINFQKYFDKNNNNQNKKHIKKNDLSNLVVLCNICHDKLHSDEIDITGTTMSSKGRKVVIKNKEKKTKIKKEV